MSIKATQPEDSAARIKGLIHGARSELYRALAGYQIDEIMDELQTAILALATPSPQPATTKEGGEEAATPAYACVRHANGEEKCSRWCGDCLASPALTEARDSIKERYTEQGSNASAGASNPYRAGSKAATYWQSGHAAAASPQPAEAVQAEPTQSEYDRVYGIVRYWSNRANYLEDQLAAKAEPAEAKTAAVDGDAKDAKRYQFARSYGGRRVALFTIDDEGKPLDILVGGFADSEIDAAIATQEGGQ